MACPAFAPRRAAASSLLLRLAAGLAPFVAVAQSDAQARANPFACSRKSLVISNCGPVLPEPTFLQWNGRLTAVGAKDMEFLDLSSETSELRFDRDIDFVKHGCPLYGIVLVQLPGFKNLTKADAEQLKEYLDAGGMLVVSDTDFLQVNTLLEDLGSSIRENTRRRRQSFPPVDCTPPATASYVPVTTLLGFPLTRGVDGLQGVDETPVVDADDSSYPLFAHKDNRSLVVARKEKHRSLVVAGSRQIFNDDCATQPTNNAFRFGSDTNLQFFQNLFLTRCQHVPHVCSAC